MPQKTAAKKAAKKTATSKRAATKTAATKTATKTTTKTATTKRAAKTAATKALATKIPASKAATTKTAAKKAAATKTTTKVAAKKVTAKRAPAKKTAVKKSPAKKSPAKKSAAGGRRVAARLVVLETESPWTTDEVAEVRAALREDVARLTAELHVAEEDLDGMIHGSEGSGNDQADVGSASFERDQEMTILHNAREMLEASERGLERITDGTFGVCENCGQPIGKNRMLAFPRATLCLSCKQREERR